MSSTFSGCELSDEHINAYITWCFVINWTAQQYKYSWNDPSRLVNYLNNYFDDRLKPFFMKKHFIVSASQMSKFAECPFNNFNLFLIILRFLPLIG